MADTTPLTTTQANRPVEKTVDQQVRDLIFLFERETDPFAFQIKGICIWPVVRFFCFENMKINMGRYNTKPVLAELPKANGLTGLFRTSYAVLCEVWKCLKWRLTGKPFDILAFTSTDRLRDKHPEGYKNIYFDYFSPPLKNILFWFDQRELSERLREYPRPYITDQFIKPFFPLAYGLALKHRDKIRTLYDSFKDFLAPKGYEDAFTISFQKWTAFFQHFFLQRLAVNQLIKFLKPKSILVECAYFKEGVVSAAKDARLPVTELQHGVFYDAHLAYIYEPVSVAEYKKCLPLPDKILTFGTYFSRILMERGFWKTDEVFDIGLARLDHFKQKIKSADPTPSPLKVLLSSQWILSEKLLDYLVRLASQLPDGVHLLVKPHPSETADQIDTYRGVSNNFEILDKRMNFYTALEQCHIHCSVFSTTLFESIGLGIPTIIIDLPGAEHVLPLTTLGGAKLADSPDQFVEILKAALSDPQYLSNWRKNIETKKIYFWQPNPGERLHALLPA